MMTCDDYTLQLDNKTTEEDWTQAKCPNRKAQLEYGKYAAGKNNQAAESLE